MPRISVNGTSLDYIERGSGEPVVFVHGSASDQRTWQIQQEEFGRHFRAIVYSRRYHWPNDRIREGADYSMAEQVDDLQALLKALRVPQAHLVGHSYGAFLCLLLAIRDPDVVRTLVLAEPPVLTLFVSMSPRPSEILRVLLTRPRTAFAIMKFAATGIGPATSAVRRGEIETGMRIFGRAVLGPEVYRLLSKSRLEQVRANFIQEELLGSGFAALDPSRVRGVRAPTLLVTGQRSPGLFHRLTDRLQELLPDSECIEIPGASHLMHEDNPAAYNEAVLSHLRRRRMTFDTSD